MVNVSVLMVVIWDGQVEWYEATVLFVMYILYFIVIFNSARVFSFVGFIYGKCCKCNKSAESRWYLFILSFQYFYFAIAIFLLTSILNSFTFYNELFLHFTILCLFMIRLLVQYALDHLYIKFINLERHGCKQTISVVKHLELGLDATWLVIICLHPWHYMYQL